MRKYFCDSCKKEVKSLNKYEVPCHLYSKYGSMGGYVDEEFNPVSGRNDVIELCNRCLNLAHSAALKAIKLNK